MCSFDFDRLARKAGATWINFAVVLAATAPLHSLIGTQLWKPFAVANCFGYTLAFRRRCLGMMVMGSYMLHPTTPAVRGDLQRRVFNAAVLGLVSVRSPARRDRLATRLPAAHRRYDPRATHGSDHDDAGRLRRALQEPRLKLGDLRGAVAAMACDLGKFRDLQPPAEITLIGLNAANAGSRRRRAMDRGFA